MGTSYSDYAAKSTSEKLILCHIEPFERMLIWTLDSGAIYTRTASHFVIDILEATTSLVEAGSSTLSSGEWFYDSATSIVYIRTSDDSNPNTKNVVATYRLFYANTPIDLPYDLLNGSDVHYEGALTSNSAITKQLDDENTGVAVESSTNISFDNTSGLFDDIYDTLFFSNKKVKLYSWNDSILMSEKQLLFDGIIQDKTFTTTKVGFKCKDFMFKLREPLSLDLFGVSDGNLSDYNLYKPKRRIYGQVDQVECVPIDNTLDGYTLTGTVSGSNAALIITGVGTAFLDEASPQDNLTITLANETLEFSVASVDSDTQITLTEAIGSDFIGATVVNAPNTPWRKKNRNFHIAGHKLRAPSTTVSSASQPNRFSVVAGTDLFEGDTIEVDGESATIKRITGGAITLEANLQAGTPSVSDVVTKNPLSKAYFGETEILIDRDWTLTNTTEAILNITNTAEFNIAKAVTMAGTFTFTSSSREVTVTGIDLLNEVKPRDWIRSGDITHTTYYEILSVTEAGLFLRIAYAGSTDTDTGAKKKNVAIIDDDSLILVNCIGMESSGTWVKTASDAVLNLLSVDAGLTNTNAASFTQADEDAPYKLSMVIPENIGGSIPKIRDVITKVNNSVFASLVNNSAWELVYNVLTPDKPLATEAPLEDHDIIGEISVKSKNDIVRKINCSYRPFVDRFTRESSFKLYEFTNSFVDNYIQSKAEKDVTVYLYEAQDAQEIAERFGLYNSMCQSTVSISGKLNFMLKNLNDKLFLNFDRLYKRFGGKDRRKIGIISKITKDGSSCHVEFNDMGNIFNRVMSICDNSALDFTSATSGEKIVNAYVLDNDLAVPDITDDDFLDTSIIG